MQKRIELGHSDFKKFIESNNYFVDKSMLIYDFFNKGAYVSLMPRPRRFGKTLNLSMIEHFFDIQKTESKQLFTDFEIVKHKEFCNQHQNKYPVINISLKGVKYADWQTCYDKFKTEIYSLYSNHIYLLQS